MDVRFDAQIFRRASDAISAMRSGDRNVDLSPVVAASVYLDGYGKTLDEFEQFDVVTRCLLRGGAQRVSKKCNTDAALLAVIREMAGATRDISKANGKLERAHAFVEQLSTLGT
jgi:hypothetical protein